MSEIAKIAFVVMATADDIEWPVAVYTTEALAKMHTNFAVRTALELALIWGCKNIPQGLNPWDEDMYSEDEPVHYYYVEVPIGKLQVKALELELVRDTGSMPKESDVGVQVQIDGQGSEHSDDVWKSGPQCDGDIVPVKELGDCCGEVFVRLEPLDARDTREGSGAEREAIIYNGEVNRDNPCIS